MEQTNLYKKSIAKQKAFINSCVEKINEALEKGNLEKIEFTEDEIAMISDIHGDLFSLMGSMAQCDFKFQKDNFIFYNPKEGEYYYEKDSKYYKYNPNGNPKETNDIIEPQPTENTELILSPMVDDSEAHPLLCLGDLLDRSPESTAILILLNTVDKFRALQGDHEFDGGVNFMYMQDKKEATEIVSPILADIKSHDKIPINTYSGKGNDVIEYSHVPTTEECITCMFDFLNDYFNGVLIIDDDDTDDKIKNEVFGALDKEFEKHKNLFNKLRLFINNHKDFDYDKIIKGGNFSIEELLIIKGVIGDALTKSEIDEEGGNRENDFAGLNRFSKLILPCGARGAVNVINFYDKFLDSEKGKSICKLCLHGHRDANEVIKRNNNVGIDVQRNEYKGGGISKVNTAVHNKKDKELKIYESKIKRNANKELDGDVKKSDSMTMELKDNKTEKPIDTDKTKENKVINYDFSNDVKSVEIDKENNIKITVSTYDFYNNKEKEEIITIKQPYDEVDCVGKNAIFAIFASENNLNINDNEKHKEIINNLVKNLFKSNKENDKRDFLNLALSNCDNIDTIKYVLSLEGVKDFITVENKKIFINATLLNKNISINHLKDIFFNGKEEEFNEYLEDNFLDKEKKEGKETKKEEGDENKNKDKFFSTIIYTDNIELLRYLKNKNLLEVEDYKILLERAVIHNKTDIFNEISNNIEEYFGEELKKEENVVELLNIYIGNKDEKLITNLLKKYKGESENIEFNEDNLKSLFKTAIETKDNAFVNGVYKILSDNKVTIKFEKEDNLKSLFEAAIRTGNTDIIDKVYNILKKDKDGVEFKNEDNLKSLFEAAIRTGNTDIIDKVYEDIFFNEKVKIGFKKNNLVFLFKTAIETKNTDIIDKVYKDIFFNEKVSIYEKKVEKDKKGILNKMMGSLLNKFNNSESLDKEINKNLFYLIKKIQKVNKTEDINFSEIKEEGTKKPLKKLFRMAVTNGEKKLALKIAGQFEKIKTKFGSSDIDTYLKPAIETGDIDLINKVFKICRINKDEFIKIIKCPEDTNKWSNLLEDLIKLPNKEAAKTIINEVSVIIKEERAKGEENCNSNSVYYPPRFDFKAKIACFMNTKLSNLLKLSIEHNNMDVFDSIIDIYKDKIFKREGNGWSNDNREVNFKDQFSKQYFSKFLDEAIKTGKAEIVNKVVKSYETVTGEELDGENLGKVEEFKKKTEKKSEPKKLNPESTEPVSTPEPKKALNIKSMPEYLSDRTVEEQEFSLNDFIGKVNKLYKDGKANEDEISFTTDTHGDLVSLMGAAAMCGVKFKENEFLYYDKVEGVYYEKVDGKYYKYDTMPYTGPQEKHGEPVNINMDNTIVVPIPDIKNARDLYHLGDVLDRGTESLTSLLFCEVCGSIKLAQGNHEFATNISIGNGGYGRELKSIELALARMKLNGRIATGFYSGKGDNVMSYSHIPLTQKHVEGFFNFLNSTYVDLKYFNKSPSVIEALDKEFVNQTGNSNLRDKVKSFLISHKDNNFKAIEKVFTKEEMLIIKNVVGDALVKRKIREDENGKITLVDGGFNDIYSDFEELRSKEDGNDRNVDILNYEDTENKKDVVVVCNGAVGHQYKESVRNSNGILYCDDKKSAGYNKGFTKVTITTLKKGTGEYKNSSCAIKRINNGIDSKFGDIKEETGLKLNKYKNSTIVDKDKTTGYDFTNDVKKIEIDGDNISITFRDGKGEKVISFKKGEYKSNLDCDGRSVIFAAVCCEDFVINNKDFVKNLFGELEKDEDKIEAINYILTNYNDIKLINEFLDLWLKKQKKSPAPITKPVGELDAKGHLIISVLSNNKIPNDKISEILKKVNNNKEYTKEEFDKNFANYKDKICSIIANPNNLGLYQYLSNNNFLDSSYYKKLLNFAIKFGNKAICDELFKNDGKKYIDDFSEEEITKLLLTAIKSEKTEFIKKVFDLYKNIKEENIEDIKKSLENNSNNISAILANSNEKVFKCFCDNFNDEDLKEIAENKLLPRICLNNPNLNMVKYLVDERKFSLEFKGQKNGRNLLHLACFGNNPNLELIKYLIEEKKINVNSLDENKDTPLNLLCQENFCKADIIKYIVTEGKADVNIKNNQNDTPLNYICVSNPNSEIVKLLLGNKENINDKNTDSKSALDYAVYDSDKFDLETINYLIDNGAIINSENEIFNKEGAFEKNFYNKENLLSFFEVYAKGCPKDRDISIKYNSNNLIGVFNKNFDQTIDLFLGALEQLYTKYSIENKDEKINDLKKKVNEITRKKNGAVANKSKQFVKLIINELNSCLTEIAQSPEKMELLNKNIDEKIQKQKEKKEKEKKEEIKGKAREEEEKKKQNEAEKKRQQEEEKKRKEEEERRKKENQPPIPPETPESTENTTTEQPNPKPKPEQETKPTQPQTEDNFEQTYKDLKQKQLKDEIKGKTVEEIKQQKKEEIENIAKTDNIKTVLTERIEEHEKKVKLVNKAIETTKSIENSSVNVVKTIKEVKGEPGTKQTAVVVKAAKNVKAENLFNDEDFRNITLDEIEVGGKVYKGFGGKIIYSYDDNSGEIRLGFDEGGFVMDQLKRMGFDKNDEYKEVYDIFENGGGLVFNKQPNGIGKEETAEFMARFKLSPVDAYLWICQDKNISIKGENGSEINSNKIKEVLTAVTEARHAMASAIYYTESIKNGMEKQKKDEDESSEEEEKEENEELNNYKELANFIKECSMKISKENSVNGFELNVNGVEFKNPIFTVKCLNKILKIVDNKVNGECREGEEEVLKGIIDNFKGNIKGNKNVILSNCLLKMYDFSLEKAGKKIDEIVKNNTTDLEL